MDPTDSELLAALGPWLPRQRWFAGKGHRITGLHMAGRHRIPAVGGAEHLIVNVQLEKAAPQTYQVPVVIGPDSGPTSLIGETSSGLLSDGMQRADVVEGLLAWGDGPAQMDPDLSPVHPQTHWSGQRPVGQRYRHLVVEQSNTSGVLGSSIFLKLFRRVTPGINPDIEIHSALAETGCQDVGRLLGWVTGGWHDPSTGQVVHGHLAMLQEYFPDSIDGWGFAGGLVAAGESMSIDARLLGRATARVHRDLATVLGTQALGSSGVAEVSERLRRRLSAAAAAVPELASIHGPLRTHLDRFEGLEDLVVQRIHGDLHLGQVLRTAGGWRLVDFEGEPGAPIEARQVMDHPARDVAGMLRSFDYASARGGWNHPGAAAWRDGAARSFLAGYAEVADGVNAVVLRAYLVDKAAYEAVYETRNRPDWLEIPMNALRVLAETRPASPGQG